MSGTFDRLNRFLNRLEESNIYYRLNKIREETILVEIAVSGERWEVEFAGDGEIIIEKFRSTGIAGPEELDRLFTDYAG